MMNKSSSFYSEAYYQKARKMAHMKRPIYRQRHKQLYDQEHELQILNYYKNLSGRCEMVRYYQLVSEVFQKMKTQTVKKNDQYNACVELFIKDMKRKMAFFHDHIMCKDFLTREQYIQLSLHSAEGIKNYWREKGGIKKEGQEEEDQMEQAESQIKGENKRLQTCNLCPIYIEQFQFNFQKSLPLIIRNCDYWEQLNGNQKISKYRSHVDQNLKVLKHQLQLKCEYSQSLGKTYRMRRPRPKKGR